MSYLQFDKTLMTNLEEALKKEVLRSNRSGAYSCSTILDCNTRKYHGLLVVPVPELDDENHVLLSSLDCTVIQHGAEFNLGLHKYQGDNYSPRGHKYIREYDCQQVPTTIYRVGGVILKRELMFQHFEDRVLVRYTLLDAEGRPLSEFNTPEGLRSPHPRTAIGYYEPGHYCLVVVDGRNPPHSDGADIATLAQLMAELGCRAAYNLDGGAMSLMVYNNQYVNTPVGDHLVSDMVIVRELSEEERSSEP